MKTQHLLTTRQEIAFVFWLGMFLFICATVAVLMLDHRIGKLERAAQEAAATKAS